MVEVVLSRERPSLATQRARYFRPPWSPRGQPWFLPLHDHFRDRGLGFTNTDPPGCRGPTYTGREVRDRTSRKGHLCNNPRVCLYCHDRQRHKATLQALHRHYTAENVLGFSIQLPTLWGDYEAVWKARQELLAWFKEQGLPRHTVWVQTFGENPSEGPKPHLDGIVSGEGTADICEGEVGQNGGRPMIGEIVELLEAWPRSVTPYGRSFWMPTGGKPRMRAIAGKARYAGRSTVPTRRYHAGGFREDEFRVDLRQWHRGFRTGGVPDPLPCKNRVDGIHGEWDLVAALASDTELQRVKNLYHSRPPALAPLAARSIARSNMWSLRWGFGKEDHLVEHLCKQSERRPF